MIVEADWVQLARSGASCCTTDSGVAYWIMWPQAGWEGMPIKHGVRNDVHGVSVRVTDVLGNDWP